MNEELNLAGVLPALITPFSDDGGAVDHGALRALVDRCVDAGVGGLVPTGSTGEFPTLSDDERRATVETVIEAADGRVPTIPCTGALSTSATVSLSQHAEHRGAAAVMIPPPFYEPLRWEELLGHFVALADNISIPIVYYNIPGATGTRLTIEQYEQLRREAHVVAIKDTSGDAVTAAELFADGDELPALINGWDTLTFSALAMGQTAVIWGAGSFMPERCVALYRLLAVERDLDAARELWSSLWPICRLLEMSGYCTAVKTACRLSGIAAGPVRPPLAALSPTVTEELAVRLERAGLSVKRV